MDEIRLGTRTLQPHRQLLVHGRREPIGKRALDILSVLAGAGGGIVTKDELFEQVWPGLTVEENALQVQIVALRKALGPEADRLKTIRGVGYQLDVDGAREDGAAPTTEESGKDRQEGATSRQPTQTVRLAPAWVRLRRFRPALIVIGMLGVMLAAAFYAGPKLGLWGGERIPIVVRTLAASGSGDPAETALANGITDELIDRLRRIPELRVATAGANGTLPESTFGGAYVVDGSIRRSEGQLRIMMRLSDKTGEVLWTQTFNRRLVDLLDMQQRVAASIADALSVSLDIGENSTAYGGTDNPEAYAAYLEASINVFNPDENRRHLEHALALDPDYIQALSAQSFGYQIRINASQELTRQQALELLAQMDESSKRALEANPNLWIGHAARGAYFAASGDYTSFERTLRRLAELDHGDERSLRSLIAGSQGFLGRSKKALALFQSAELIDPGGRPELGRVTTLLDLRRYREAIDLAEELGEADPRTLQNLSGEVFWSYLALGKEAEAMRFSEQVFPPWAEQLRAFRSDEALATMSPEALRQWADRRYGGGGGIHLVNQAHFAGFEGHPRLAVELLRLAFERPSGGLAFLLWRPALAEARKTDEFEKLVTDMGLVKIWRESGDWGDFCRPVSATEITCI